MADQLSKFEAHRAQLSASLNAVADTMRNCAQLAESFAKIVTDTSFTPEMAELVQGAFEDIDGAKGKRKAAFSPEDTDGPKKRKRNTKPKDPNAPKRPASSYILFQNEVRKELKEQHPNLDNAGLLSLIAEQWKNMPEEQKETYNQAMKNAKAQYSEEKKAYDNRTPAEIDAANAAAAEAQALKKANAKPRGPKPGAAAAQQTNLVPARPPPPPEVTSPSTDSSEDSDSDEEPPAPQQKSAPVEPDSDSDEESEEEPAPAPKKRRGGSVKPVSKDHKSKKGSKA